MTNLCVSMVLLQRSMVDVRVVVGVCGSLPLTPSRGGKVLWLVFRVVVRLGFSL